MTWFKVDDVFPFHPKAIAAGNAALGLWLRAGSWSLQQLTDGWVPDHVIATLGKKSEAISLVRAKLWHAPGHECERCPSIDAGYLFHDWLDYQPSADEIRAERASKHEAKVKAGQLGGIASGVARRKHNPSKREANAKQNEAPTRPDPTIGSYGSVSNETFPPRPGEPESAIEAWATTEQPRTWEDELKAELERHYGCEYPWGWVARTIEMVIGSKEVKDPVRYVMAAVAKNSRRYGPTNVPKSPLAHLAIGDMP